MKKGYLLALIILTILIIDQSLKVYIKTHFEYNDDIPLFGDASWARLHFVENEGMAFGITFDWAYGKLLLSFFRVLMVGGLIWYMKMLIQNKAPLGFQICIALITAGALGNILDSAFYGMIFTASGYHGGLAEYCAFGEGYAKDALLNGFMHGKVVDMFYFPIKNFSIPDWSPIWGGESFLFFSPIFNVADAAISIGVVCIFLFQRRFFKDSYLEDKEEGTTLHNQDAAVEAALDKIEALETSEHHTQEAEIPSEAESDPEKQLTPASDPTRPLL